MTKEEEELQRSESESGTFTVQSFRGRCFEWIYFFVFFHFIFYFLPPSSFFSFSALLLALLSGIHYPFRWLHSTSKLMALHYNGLPCVCSTEDESGDERMGAVGPDGEIDWDCKCSGDCFTRS